MTLDSVLEVAGLDTLVAKATEALFYSIEEDASPEQPEVRIALQEVSGFLQRAMEGLQTLKAFQEGKKIILTRECVDNDRICRIVFFNFRDSRVISDSEEEVRECVAAIESLLAGSKVALSRQQSAMQLLIDLSDYLGARVSAAWESKALE